MAEHYGKGICILRCPKKYLKETRKFAAFGRVFPSTRWENTPWENTHWKNTLWKNAVWKNTVGNPPDTPGHPPDTDSTFFMFR